MNILREFFSDADGLQPSEVMGFIMGIATIVLAFQKNTQAGMVGGICFSLFTIGKGANAYVKGKMAGASPPATPPTAPSPAKPGPPVPGGKGAA